MVALVISCSAIVGIPCDRSTRSAYRESERTSVMCDCTEIVAHSDTQDFHVGYSFNSCYIVAEWANVRRPAHEERGRHAELAQIGGRPARQAPPHQGRDPVRDVLWEWKPVQYSPHILGYVVKLPEPTPPINRSIGGLASTFPSE